MNKGYSGNEIGSTVTVIISEQQHLFIAPPICVVCVKNSQLINQDMLKIQQPIYSETNKSLKCGEIFCFKSTTYSVNCYYCCKLIEFENFRKHFQSQHMPKGTSNDEDLPEIKTESEAGATEIDVDMQCKLEEIEDEKPIALEDLKIGQIQTFVEYLDHDGKSTKMNPEEMKTIMEGSDWNEDNNNDDFDDASSMESVEEMKDPPRVRCPHCKGSYKNKDSLAFHIRKSHSNGKGSTKKRARPSITEHKCNHCDQKFRFERSLRNHQYTHTGIVCEVCGRKFASVGNLMVHKVRHSGVKSFKCKECSYSSFTVKELRAHMLCHNGEPIVCEVCGIPCRDRYKLTAHMRRHTGDRPAKCDVCGKSFFSFYDLKVHSVAHSLDRPFKCDICESTFQLKKSLRVHKKIHMRDQPKPYVCQICEKSFALENGLTAHLRSHDPNRKSLHIVKEDSKSST